ncbi:MAG: AAA family ATPase [Flavobacteriia bacterium]|nr:AAA family ATPase [Flavobacteriia bacterium]
MQTFTIQFEKVFRKLFPYSLSQNQEDCLNNWIYFLNNPSQYKVFILKGYAGTGKTTFASNLVTSLKHFNKKSILLAPTGRAAKVFSSYSKTNAYTIHKKIYVHTRDLMDYSVMSLAKNKENNTFFLVDEASMIMSSTSNHLNQETERNVLLDLLNFVFSGKNNILLLLGDEGQLPPVGSTTSPALNIEYLKQNFPKIDFTVSSLNQIIRQNNTSQIVLNAHQIRNCLANQWPKISFLEKDVHNITSLELQDYLQNSFQEQGVEECIILTKSNLRASIYNQEIRKRILFYEEFLERNERIMVIKNSYFWVDEKSELGFIANGDILTIKKLIKIEERYGFHFAHVIVSFDDYPEMDDLKLIVHLSTLTNKETQLSKEDNKKLFHEIELDYIDEPIRKKRIEQVFKDPFFNALQVKYAYCITTHKAQGGQWNHVFIDHGKLDDEFLQSGFQRWLYTAITRAKKKVYLVNFDEKLLDSK